MAYTYPAMVAWDSIGKLAVKSTSFQVYAVADTGFVTPLAITDSFGVALPGNILNSGAIGVFPEFKQADNATVVITDAARNYVWTITSILQDASVAGFVSNKTTATAAAVRTATASAWQASVAYAVNQPVINPTGDLMRCTTAHTSTATYDSTKFTLSATDANGATSAALSATYGPDAAAPRAAFARTPHAGTTRFNRDVIDAISSGTARYASMPSIIATQSGDLLVIWRRSSNHDIGAVAGTAWAKLSKDGGRTWTTPAEAFAVAGSNIQDLFLSRFGEERRIYALYHRTLDTAATVQGTYLRYTDDDGATWSAEFTVQTGTVASGSPIRKSLDGTKYLIPTYSIVGGFWTSTLHSATDPLGVWTSSTAAAPASVDSTEWDFAQVSATNWIGLFRQGSGVAGQIRQSVDGGVTWSAPTALATAFPINIGWPRTILLDDGSIMAWYKASGAGLRAVQLTDVDNPLVASNWKDPHAFPAVGIDNSTTNTGKMEVTRYGNTYKAVYYGEDPAFADRTVATVKLAEFTPQTFRAGRSFILTTETAANATTPYQVLTTPDRVKFRSQGEYVRIYWQVESFSAATIENWNAAIYINDVFQDDASVLAVGASTQSAANSAYCDNRETQTWLAPGLHTIELRFRVQTGTVARSIRRRLLTVTPQSA